AVAVGAAARTRRRRPEGRGFRPAVPGRHREPLMSGPLAALAPALLAAIVAQGPKTPTPPCLPPEAHLDDFETGWFCGQLAAAGKGRLDGPKAFRLLYLPSFR